MAVTTVAFIENNSREWENAGEGVRRKILGYDDALMMVRVEFKKGAIGYLHHHPHRQVSYIERGSFEVQIGGEKKILRAGDCYFASPNIEHGVVALEESRLLDVFAPMREDFVNHK
jgi:quercetin dioxygenase-like cupin family protein